MHSLRSRSRLTFLSRIAAPIFTIVTVGLATPAHAAEDATMATSAAPAAPAAAASTEEDLRVAETRLSVALDRARSARASAKVEDRDELRKLTLQARTAKSQVPSALHGSQDEMRMLTAELTRLRDALSSLADRLGSVPPAAAAYTEVPATPGPFAVSRVIAFREAAAAVERSRDRLKADEWATARRLIREGQDEAAVVRAARDTDHVTRDAALDRLDALREKLASLRERASLDRHEGYGFVPQAWTNQAWMDLRHAENGLEATRARFAPPGSAHVTVRNPGQEPKPAALRLEFFNAPGDRTGSADYETPAGDELRPGELREILVPIVPSAGRFWDVTRTFTLHVE